VVEAVSLHDLLVRLPGAEDLPKHGLGRPKAGGSESPTQWLADRIVSAAAEGAPLAQAVPGDDPQVAVHDVEPDGESVEHGSQPLREGGRRGASRHAESIAARVRERDI
jgi:hypothetical protein